MRGVIFGGLLLAAMGCATVGKVGVINDLAGVLSRQGKYEVAETLFRQALAMRQKLLDHMSNSIGEMERLYKNYSLE